MNTYTLLIWEEIPETLKLFLIPDDIILEDHRRALECINEKLMNSDKFSQKEEMLHAFVSVAILDEKSRGDFTFWENVAWNDELVARWVCRFSPYRVKMNETVTRVDKTISFIYHSGHVM